MGWKAKPDSRGKRWRREHWGDWDEAKRMMYFCNGKICYATRQEAELSAMEQVEKGYSLMRVYYHIDCATFHLTSRTD